MPLQRHVFQSRHLHVAQYDTDERTLMIQFANGAVYLYADVPQTTVDKLFQTGSSQEYFNDHVRGAYRYTKLADGMSQATGRRSRSKRF